MGLLQTETMDMDMMIDACLLLWNKCKNIFAKFQTGSADNPRYLQKMDNPSKVTISPSHILSNNYVQSVASSRSKVWIIVHCKTISHNVVLTSSGYLTLNS